MEARRAGGPSGLPVPTYALETPKPQSRLGKMRQSLGGSHAHAAPPVFPADRSMNTSGHQVALTQSAIKPSQSVRRQSTRPPTTSFNGAQTLPLALRTPYVQSFVFWNEYLRCPIACANQRQYLSQCRQLLEPFFLELRTCHPKS